MNFKYKIICRKHRVVNTDPLRRCYNGAYARTALVWTAWEDLDYQPTLERAQGRLKFWSELNDYAVSQRGQSAKREHKIVEVPDEL